MHSSLQHLRKSIASLNLESYMEAIRILSHPFIHLISIYSELSLCEAGTSHGYMKGFRQYKGNPRKHQIKKAGESIW